VQTPDFDLMFRGINTDLSVTNQNQSYGRDLEFGKTIIFEFGIRHAFSQDMVLDVAAYNKDKISTLPALMQLPHPAKNGETVISVCSQRRLRQRARRDVRLDRRFSNLFSGSVAYTFQVARNTGSDRLRISTRWRARSAP